MSITSDIDELVKLQRATLARLSVGPAELLDVEAVAVLIGVSANTVWLLTRNGGFPLPVDIGVELTRWRRSEILTWIEKRKPRKKPKKTPSGQQST